jgi:hypothetical protein
MPIVRRGLCRIRPSNIHRGPVAQDDGVDGSKNLDTNSFPFDGWPRASRGRHGESWGAWQASRTESRAGNVLRIYRIEVTRRHSRLRIPELKLIYVALSILLNLGATFGLDLEGSLLMVMGAAESTTNERLSSPITLLERRLAYVKPCCWIFRLGSS